MFDQTEINAVMGQMQDPLGLIPGKKVHEFEARVAEFMGKKYGVMVNSGSSALMVAMRLAQLPRGSEVITPVLDVLLGRRRDLPRRLHAGLRRRRPLRLPDPRRPDRGGDRSQDEGDPDPGPRRRDLRLGHRPQDRRRHGLFVIHDSADTLGGKLRGRHTASRADVSITSFSIFHIITALGNGGMVFFDDEKYFDRSLSLRAWGRSSEKWMHGTKAGSSDGRFLEKVDGIDYDALFIFEENAYGFIPNECGAAFGVEQMNKIDTLWKLREERFRWHTDFLKKHEDKFILPTIIPETETTWLCYPIQIRPETGCSRTKFQIQLEDAGITSRVIFSGNITRQPMLKNQEYRIAPAGLATADQIMAYGIMLPCHPTMTREDCEYVYQTIQDFIDAKGEVTVKR